MINTSRNVPFIVMLVVSLIGCQKTPETIQYNEELNQQLLVMMETDQYAAGPGDRSIESERWEVFKDSVFRKHRMIAGEILEDYGYPGYNLVGEDGSRAFWLLVQHADFDVQFQKEVLKAMEKEVEHQNANSRHFGLLTDRVALNSGELQIYGTQVEYNHLKQAVPRPLFDSINVNIRRAEVGLEPLEVYLNIMTQMHFEMNRESFIKQGITEPLLYDVPQE